MLGDVNLTELTSHTDDVSGYAQWTNSVSAQAGDWLVVTSFGGWSCENYHPEDQGTLAGTAQFITHKKTVGTGSGASSEGLYTTAYYVGLYEITAPGTFRAMGFNISIVRARFTVFNGANGLIFLA